MIVFLNVLGLDFSQRANLFHTLALHEFFSITDRLLTMGSVVTCWGGNNFLGLYDTAEIIDIDSSEYPGSLRLHKNIS